MRALLLLSCLLLVAGCDAIVGPRTPRVDMVTDRTSYRVDEEVVLRVTNRSAATVYHDGIGCVVLERWNGTEWQQRGTIAECFVIAYPAVPLAPRETATGRFPIDATFEANAEHRFALIVERRNRRSVRAIQYSNVFSVVE